MNRNKRAQMAQETLQIIERGSYATDGQQVDIGHQVTACLERTRLFTPEELDRLAAEVRAGQNATEFAVRNETTLSAARRLVVERQREEVLCLNFASAKNPGGGFLGGSQAQEESLARSSALYASLQTQMRYYELNRACGTSLYTDHMILSPAVPVFRDDDGNLLAEPYVVSMLTAPAVNAGAVTKNDPANRERIGPVMQRRIGKLLALAAHAGYQHLVLGAWGCGVFRNDPAEIAELFAAALHLGGSFVGCFASVTFAVLDGTADQAIITPFRQRFAGDTI